jgi:hypothetical protein
MALGLSGTAGCKRGNMVVSCNLGRFHIALRRADLSVLLVARVAWTPAFVLARTFLGPALLPSHTFLGPAVAAVAAA